MPVNGSFAPICPVSRSQAPVARAAAPIAIPRAIDLPSAIQAINQLIQIYNPLIQNNLSFNYVPGWREIRRSTAVVRVSNPNDPEQWVDVERINRLVFQDSTTDAMFEWQYNNPALRG